MIGLAEWAHSFVSPRGVRRFHVAERRAPLPRGYWWRRFPIELLFGFMDVISDRVWRVLSEQFHVDDHGALHVRDRAVAVAVGVAVGLLFMAFQMWGVWNYDVGFRQGMAAHWSTH